MAISAKNAGSYVDTASSTTLTVTLPAHAAGDMLIVRAACKQYDATITCGTSGWAAVGNAYANGSTSNGNGVGSLNHRAFYKVATSGSETNPVVTFGATPSPGMAVAIVYQKASTDTWETPTGAGGGDSTARTSQTCTISSHISVRTGDMIDFWLAWCDNYDSTNPTITQSGVTFDTVAEYPATAHTTNTGNDGAMDGGYRLATAGTSSAAAVVTATFGNAEQGGAWQTRLRVSQGITPDLIDSGRAIYGLTVAFPPQTLTVGLIESTATIYAPTLTPYKTLALALLSPGEGEFTRGTQVFADDFSGFSTSTWTGPDTGGGYIWSTYWTNNDNRSEDGVGVIGAVLIDTHAGMSYSDGLSYADVEVQVDIDPTTWGYGFDHGGIAYRHQTASGGFYILGLTLIDATHISLTLKHTPYNSMGYGDGTPIASSGSLAVTTSFATWRIHGFAVGNRHVARIWLASGSEPTSWQIDVTDNTYTSAGSIALWDDSATDDNQTAFDNAGAWQATLEGGGAAIYAITVEEGGPKTVTLGLIDSGSSIYALTVIPDQFIEPGLIESTSAIYEPTLVGKNTVSPEVIDASRAIYDVTVLGKNDLAVGLIESTSAVYEPTVLPTNTLSLAAIEQAPAIYDPTLGLAPYPISLDLIESTSAIYGPTLEETGGGPKTVEPGLIDAGSAVYGPTVEPAPYPISLALVESTSAIYDLALTLAPYPVTVGLIESTSAIYGPEITTTGGAGGGGPLIPLLLGLGLGGATAQTAYPGLIDSGSAIYSPTISYTQSVEPGLIDSGSAIYGPTVTLAPYPISLGLIDSGSAIYGPTLLPTNALAPALIDSGSAIYGPTVLPINSISLGAIESTSAIYGPTVTLAPYPISLGLIDSGSAIYDVTVVEVGGGTKTVLPDLIDSGSAIYDLTLLGKNAVAVGLIDASRAIYGPTLVGKNTLEPVLIDAVSGIFALAVAPAPYPLTLGLIDSGSAIYGPVIQPQAVTIGTALLDAVSAIYDPTLVGTNSLSLGLIDAAGAIYGPALAAYNTISPSLIDASRAIYGPTLIQDQFIEPGLIDSGSAIYSPTISGGLLLISLPLLTSTQPPAVMIDATTGEVFLSVGGPLIVKVG